jgi:hypothetical protein
MSIGIRIAGLNPWNQIRLNYQQIRYEGFCHRCRYRCYWKSGSRFFFVYDPDPGMKSLDPNPHQC